jgi:hypothetical protein
VRRGASWTAADHRQLTVAAVARPVHSSVVPSASLPVSGPGGCSPRWRLPAGASSRVSRGRAWSPWSTRPAATPRRRSPVSSRRCPPIRSRRPGSGCPAVRCPVTWAGRPAGPAVGRLLSSCPVSSCPVSIRAVSGRLVSALVGSDASVSSHSGGAVGTGSRWPGDPGHRDGWRLRWLPGRRRLDRRSRRPGRGRCCRSRVGQGGRWRPGPPGRGAGRGGRACPPSDQAGQAGVRGARRGRRRGGHEGQAAARGGGSRRVAGVLGWGRDHGGWSSPRLTGGWAGPEGPGEVPAGMGVRPQRGPGRQRPLPARCRQRCDLRRWVVGLPGLEPGTSS